MQGLQSRQGRAALLIALLGAAVVIAVSPFAIGLLGSLVLYVMFVGQYRQYRRVMGPDPAAGITLLIALLVIVLPLTWVVALVVEQAPDTVKAVRENNLLGRLQGLRIGRFDIGAEIARASNALVAWISAQALGFVGSAAQATINMVIAFFGLFYMLTSGEKSWKQVREYIPFPESAAEQLRERFFSVTRATLLGTALTATVQGTIVGVGFALVGFPSPAFWGVVTAIASILPVLGSALVWLPGVIVLLASNRPGAAVLLGVLGGLLASNVDNVLRPIIYRRVSNIHPMITLVGAFAGVKYFGLLGVLLGPLAIAYLFELLQLYREEYGTPRYPKDGSPDDLTDAAGADDGADAAASAPTIPGQARVTP